MTPVIPCKYISGQLGEACMECGEPFEFVVKMVGETRRGPMPVGPRNLECRNGHIVLDAAEQLASATIPVFVPDR